MHQDDRYRGLTAANLLVVQTRERIDKQKARVLALNGRSECGEVVKVLRSLDRSLRRMLRGRAVLIKQLMNGSDARRA